MAKTEAEAKRSAKAAGGKGTGAQKVLIRAI